MAPGPDGVAVPDAQDASLDAHPRKLVSPVAATGSPARASRATPSAGGEEVAGVELWPHCEGGSTRCCVARDPEVGDAEIVAQLEQEARFTVYYRHLCHSKIWLDTADEPPALNAETVEEYKQHLRFPLGEERTDLFSVVWPRPLPALLAFYSFSVLYLLLYFSSYIAKFMAKILLTSHAQVSEPILCFGCLYQFISFAVFFRVHHSHPPNAQTLTGIDALGGQLMTVRALGLVATCQPPHPPPAHPLIPPIKTKAKRLCHFISSAMSNTFSRV